MSLTLFGGARSRASMPRWYMEEKGIPYTWQQLDMEAGEHKQPAFTAINPFAKVPALVDTNLQGPGGEPLHLFESGAILLHLADRYGGEFTGTSEDIREVIAEMLLNVDPSKVILEYTPPTDGDGRPLPEAEHLLGEFTTGKLFQQFSFDASRFGEIDGNPVVPLCFGVWADETTTSSSRNMSELPVYIALLNAGRQITSCQNLNNPHRSVIFYQSCWICVVGDAYQMHFLAYAPFRLPHS